MNKLYKAVLLATLGLAGMATARAADYNGDLLIGFTSGTGNDLIYDLGAASSLSDGQTWDLTSLLTGYNLNTVNWGVIGDVNFGGVRTAWITTEGAATPNSIPSLAAWSPIYLATKAIYQNFDTAGSGQFQLVDSTFASSWNQETTINGLGNSGSYISNEGNPNVTGPTSANVFGMVANGSAPSLAGNFSLDNTGVLTFSVSQVPEPGAASLIGGGALLLLALRNKFRRPQS